MKWWIEFHPASPLRNVASNWFTLKHDFQTFDKKKQKLFLGTVERSCAVFKQLTSRTWCDLVSKIYKFDITLLSQQFMSKYRNLSKTECSTMYWEVVISWPLSQSLAWKLSYWTKTLVHALDVGETSRERTNCQQKMREKNTCVVEYYCVSLSLLFWQHCREGDCDKLTKTT